MTAVAAPLQVPYCRQAVVDAGDKFSPGGTSTSQRHGTKPLSSSARASRLTKSPSFVLWERKTFIGVWVRRRHPPILSPEAGARMRADSRFRPEKGKNVDSRGFMTAAE